MRQVEVIRVPEGQTGQITKFKELDEDVQDALVGLVAGGMRDYEALGKELGLNVLTVRNALRNPRVQGAIAKEVQAMALLLMPEALASAHKDMTMGEPRGRPMARAFIRRVAEGPQGAAQVVNQVNNLWDPSQDEELMERGRQFFAEFGGMIAAETVKAVLKDEDDL